MKEIIEQLIEDFRGYWSNERTFWKYTISPLFNSPKFWLLMMKAGGVVGAVALVFYGLLQWP